MASPVKLKPSEAETQVHVLDYYSLGKPHYNTDTGCQTTQNTIFNDSTILLALTN